MLLAPHESVAMRIVMAAFAVICGLLCSVTSMAAPIKIESLRHARFEEFFRDYRTRHSSGQFELSEDLQKKAAKGNQVRQAALLELQKRYGAENIPWILDPLGTLRAELDRVTKFFDSDYSSPPKLSRDLATLFAKGTTQAKYPTYSPREEASLYEAQQQLFFEDEFDFGRKAMSREKKADFIRKYLENRLQHIQNLLRETEKELYEPRYLQGELFQKKWWERPLLYPPHGKVPRVPYQVPVENVLVPKFISEDLPETALADPAERLIRWMGIIQEAPLILTYTILVNHLSKPTFQLGDFVQELNSRLKKHDDFILRTFKDDWSRDPKAADSIIGLQWWGLTQDLNFWTIQDQINAKRGAKPIVQNPEAPLKRPGIFRRTWAKVYLAKRSTWAAALVASLLSYFPLAQLYGVPGVEESTAKIVQSSREKFNQTVEKIKNIDWGQASTTAPNKMYDDAQDHRMTGIADLEELAKIPLLEIEGEGPLPVALLQAPQLSLAPPEIQEAFKEMIPSLKVRTTHNPDEYYKPSADKHAFIINSRAKFGPRFYLPIPIGYKVQDIMVFTNSTRVPRTIQGMSPKNFPQIVRLDLSKWTSEPVSFTMKVVRDQSLELPRPNPTLDTQALKIVSAELRKEGYRLLADRLDSKLERSLTLLDLWQVFQSSGFYQRTKLKNMPTNYRLNSLTLGSMKRFQSDGILCGQCDEAQFLFVPAMNRYYELAGSKTRALPFRVIATGGATIISFANNHMVTLLADPHSLSEGSIWDATPSSESPLHKYELEQLVRAAADKQDLPATLQKIWGDYEKIFRGENYPLIQKTIAGFSDAGIPLNPDWWERIVTPGLLQHTEKTKEKNAIYYVAQELGEKMYDEGVFPKKSDTPKLLTAPDQFSRMLGYKIAAHFELPEAVDEAKRLLASGINEPAVLHELRGRPALVKKIGPETFSTFLNETNWSGTSLQDLILVLRPVDTPWATDLLVSLLDHQNINVRKAALDALASKKNIDHLAHAQKVEAHLEEIVTSGNLDNLKNYPTPKIHRRVRELIMKKTSFWQPFWLLAQWDDPDVIPLALDYLQENEGPANASTKAAIMELLVTKYPNDSRVDWQINHWPDLNTLTPRTILKKIPSSLKADRAALLQYIEGHFRPDTSADPFSEIIKVLIDNRIPPSAHLIDQLSSPSPDFVSDYARELIKRNGGKLPPPLKNRTPEDKEARHFVEAEIHWQKAFAQPKFVTAKDARTQITGNLISEITATEMLIRTSPEEGIQHLKLRFHLWPENMQKFFVFHSENSEAFAWCAEHGQTESVRIAAGNRLISRDPVYYLSHPEMMTDFSANQLTAVLRAFLKNNPANPSLPTAGKISRKILNNSTPPKKQEGEKSPPGLKKIYLKREESDIQLEDEAKPTIPPVKDPEKHRERSIVLENARQKIVKFLKTISPEERARNADPALPHHRILQIVNALEPYIAGQFDDHEFLTRVNSDGSEVNSATELIKSVMNKVELDIARTPQNGALTKRWSLLGRKSYRALMVETAQSLRDLNWQPYSCESALGDLKAKP